MPVDCFIGVDLAWGEGDAATPANETGVAALDRRGLVVAAGWTRGVIETTTWIESIAGDGSVLLFVDAPLVVDNVGGQRLCETQVGQRYGRWKVSANTTNLASRRLAGVALLARLRECGWRYDDGRNGPPADGRTISECYPYTTLVGVEELGYDQERPRYKRKPRTMPTRQWRAERAATCDELIRRLGRLRGVDPPLLLESDPVTGRLLTEPSPLDQSTYKHREDLIDAVLCAWTAAFWHRYGLAHCQVLGPPIRGDETTATIIAPSREQQRGRVAAPCGGAGE